MNIEKGYKIVLSKEKGKSHIEITRHKVSYMDNILIVNSIGSTRYQDTWIIENDLETWISSIKKEGFINIKIVEDVESPKKNKKKKE
jgi:hypothetical protein